MKSKLSCVSLAIVLLAILPASAAIVIDTVLVGDEGNANDPITSLGSVAYRYEIGTYEVTNGEYTAFLNGVAATDNYDLYNPGMSINRSGSSGSYTYTVNSAFENEPVTFVSFWDAARFANWLTNGQGNGDTETGMYNLGGVLEPINDSVSRDTAAFSNGGWALPSENEWYKAAYYNGSGGYFLYPTQSNADPAGENPPGGSNSANYDGAVGGITDVGSYTNSVSPYGTFDQGGNINEWNEDLFVGGLRRGLRGGSWRGDNTVVRLASTGGNNFANPIFQNSSFGFRVARGVPIPEPSAYAAILGCLGLALTLAQRKRRGNC